MTNILRFDEIGMGDLARVGGKNASLGEMVSHLASAGIRVPPGFATTSDAFGRFLAHDGLDAASATRSRASTSTTSRPSASSGAACARGSRSSRSPTTSTPTSAPRTQPSSRASRIRMP